MFLKNHSLDCQTMHAYKFAIIKFLTSNNEILAIWLVRETLVTRHSSHVWLEMNGANVARYKLFLWKANLADKSEWKKQIWWAIYRLNTTNCGQFRLSENKKSHKVRHEIIERYVSVKLPLKVKRLRIWQSKFYAFIKVLELKKTGSRIASVVQKKIILREQLKKLFDSSELGPAGNKNSRTATECDLVFTSVSFLPDEDERINTS